MRHPARRAAAILVAAATLLTLGAPDTIADTNLSTSGKVGVHQLRDSHAAPGLRCGYVETPTAVLDTMKVKAPKLWARDTSAGRDKQQVTWQILVQSWDVNGFWDTVATHGPWAATAWDDAPAPFSARWVAPPLGAGTSYRVLIRMRWLGPSGVVGTSKHRVDWAIRAVSDYAQTVGPKAACPEHLND